MSYLSTFYKAKRNRYFFEDEKEQKVEKERKKIRKTAPVKSYRLPSLPGKEIRSKNGLPGIVERVRCYSCQREYDRKLKLIENYLPHVVSGGLPGLGKRR